MKKIILTLVLIINFATYSTADAYSCWEKGNVNDRIGDADAVFSGEVVQIEELGATKEELGTERYNILFMLERIWKGLEDERDEGFVYADVEELYEYKFEKGQRYLVIAYKLYPDRLTIVGCPRAKKVENAEIDIKMLGKPQFVVDISGTSSKK